MSLSAYHPLCDAIALLLQPQAEVVLHDLATETVAHIANPFSQVWSAAMLLSWFGQRKGRPEFKQAAQVLEDAVAADVTPNLHPIAIRASVSLLRVRAGEARGCVA